MVRECLTEKVKYAQRSKGSERECVQKIQKSVPDTQLEHKCKCPEAGTYLVFELQLRAQTVKC